MENKPENDKLKQVSFPRDVEPATSPDLIFFFSEQLLWQTLLADAFLWMQTRTKWKSLLSLPLLLWWRSVHRTILVSME